MLGVLILLSAGGNAEPPEPTPSAAPAAETAATDPHAGEAPPAVTSEQRVAALEHRIAEQDERIAALEAERAHHAAGRSHTESAPPGGEKEPPPAVIDRAQRDGPLIALASKDFPRSIPMFGSDLRFALGGYVKLDALYDFSGHPDRYRFTLPGIPKEGDPEQQGYVFIHARETRFKLDVRYFGENAPSNQAFVEIDFFTPSLTQFAAPRLRHAYLRWGDFLAGQTWALLTDMRPLPFIIDFAFADSVNATRVAQLRYQTLIHGFVVLRAGVEMPETSGVDNPAAAPGAVSPRLPRAALAVSLEGKRGFVSGGASLGEIRWDDGGSGADPTTLAWMAVLNARYLLDTEGRGFLGAHASVGQATGELIGTLAGQNSNATLVDGALIPMPSGHGMVGAGCRWIDALSTNAAIAWDVLVPSPERSDSALAWAWSVHANVVGHISEPLRIGIEGMLGESATADGRVGRGARIQTMAMYSF